MRVLLGIVWELLKAVYFISSALALLLWIIMWGTGVVYLK